MAITGAAQQHAMQTLPPSPDNTLPDEMQLLLDVCKANAWLQRLGWLVLNWCICIRRARLRAIDRLIFTWLQSAEG
jgi:hypothetical protein